MRKLLFAALFFLLPSTAGAGAPPRPFPGNEALPSLHFDGSVESFDGSNLWEKINGEAELFIRYGLKGARFARYTGGSSGEESLEIGIYEMGDPLGAFGLFALFSSGSAVIPIGNGVVTGTYQGYLHHGNLFVIADGFLPQGREERILRGALKAIAANLGIAPELPAAVTFLQGLLSPGEIRYAPEHLLSRTCMPPGLEASASRLFFVATAAIDGPALLDACEKTLEGPSRSGDGTTSFLKGHDKVAGYVTIAVRGGRLAGFTGARFDEEADRIVLHLLDAPFPGGQTDRP